jgi:signal transduction histidine kinase
LWQLSRLFVGNSVNYKRSSLLAYISTASEQEASDLRNLLDWAASAAIVAWYDRHWSVPTTAANVIAAIASALRTAMTIIYGNIDLLRAHTKPNERQEALYQQIVAVVDTLRVCRNQLRSQLAENDVDIRPF